MAEPVKIVTGIGNAELHRILVRGVKRGGGTVRFVSK